MATTEKYSIGSAANYSTGTVTTGGASNLTVTLSGGTFPTYIGEGDLIVMSAVNYYVESRDSDTQVTLQSWQTVPSHSGIAYTIGRAYSNFSAFETAQQQDCVANDVIIKGVMRADSTFTGDTNRFNIQGWTFDATRYLWITTVESERHLGVFDAGVVIDASLWSSVGLAVGGYLLLEWLEIKNMTNTYAKTIEFRGQQHVCRYNIFRDNDSSGAVIHFHNGNSSWDNDIHDNIFADNNTVAIFSYQTSIAQPGNRILNNIVYNNATGIASLGTRSASLNRDLVRNNIVLDNTTQNIDTNWSGSRWSMVADKNLVNGNDAFPTSPSSPDTNTIYVIADEVFTDKDNNDFSSKEGSPGIFYGNNESGNTRLSNDLCINGIVRNTNAQPWDCGAFKNTTIVSRIGTGTWSGTVNTTVTTKKVDWISGDKFDSYGFRDGSTITINSVDYVIDYVETDEILYLIGDPGTQSGVSFSIANRDYTTMTAWETATASDLTSTERIWKGETYADSTFDELTVLAGVTTSTSYYQWLTVAEGQRHSGNAFSGGVVVDRGGKVGTVVTMSTNYARVEWLRITNWSSTYSGVAVPSGPTGTICNKLIIHDATNTSGYSLTGISILVTATLRTVTNCIIYNLKSTAAVPTANTTGIAASYLQRVYNNTVYNIEASSTANAVIGIRNSNATTYVANNIVLDVIGGVLNACYSAAFDSNSKNNMSSDATATSANSLINKSAVDQFTSITASAEDLSLKPFSEAIEAGTYLAATDLATDAAGEARPESGSGSDWDMGALHSVVVTTSIGTDVSRTYSTFAAWETGEQGDLVAQNRIRKGLYYGDTVLTAGCVIAGGTTDANHYMWLSSAPGQRNIGLRNSAARIDMNTASGNCFEIQDDYSVIEWIEIYNLAGTASTDRAIYINASNCFVAHNVIRDFDAKTAGYGIYATSADGSANNTLYRNVVYNTYAGIQVVDTSSANDSYIYNNTVFDCIVGIGGTNGSGVNFSSNIAIGNTTNWNVTSYKTADRNMGEPLEAVPGSSPRYSIPATEFRVITSGSEDLRLTDGAVAVGNGRDFGDDYPPSARFSKINVGIQGNVIS